MSNSRAGTSAALTGARFARELGEIAQAALVAPWGCTAAGTRALRWLLAFREKAAVPTYLTPVVLVHGYGGSRANWLPLDMELRRAGFANIHTAAYGPRTATLSSVARSVRILCHKAMEEAGSGHVHLIGHSLGGVVVRYAVLRMGLATDVRTAVTVAAPHRGTPLAWLGRGSLARDLRPGSPVLQGLDRAVGAGDVRWVAYYSEGDLVVRPDSARLEEHGLRAVNVEVPDVGHLGILRAPVFLRSVRHLLLVGERSAERRSPAADTAAPVVA